MEAEQRPLPQKAPFVLMLGSVQGWKDRQKQGALPWLETP
ncbi:hypothetical protein ATPR_0830 [Acetobacter tropicalis NBRC 101654]|uniref:Uncharacterized protein n=1 Tax=Acetobacter tropicalis NBRC 101654 TaxID=749388 RepID=F7VBT2_9PROT|nr:hypothetical protein ATPR_0830 [Acetobacter tropicalis NBRC 101654]